jgi:hypothetical protein
MDWHQNGERLRKEWRENALEGIKRELPPQLISLMESLPEPGPGNMWEIKRRREGLSDEFMEALNASTDDDMSPLANYVASDKPLSQEERKVLSLRLPKRKTGRPQDTQLRTAASIACMFYKEWRELNKRLQVRDHGHCPEMKEYAAQWMVEDWFWWGSKGQELNETNKNEFVASVRERMEKPARLRDTGGKGVITFPAFGWDSKTSKTRG